MKCALMIFLTIITFTATSQKIDQGDFTVNIFRSQVQDSVRFNVIVKPLKPILLSYDRICIVRQLINNDTVEIVGQNSYCPRFLYYDELPNTYHNIGSNEEIKFTFSISKATFIRKFRFDFEYIPLDNHIDVIVKKELHYNQNDIFISRKNEGKLIKTKTFNFSNIYLK